MTKTYKHKKQEWVAEKRVSGEGIGYVISDTQGVVVDTITHKYLIENSDDWELQTEEKDWIEVCAIKIGQVFSIDATPETDVIIDIIDGCMPKITKEELDTIMYDDDYGNMVFDVGIIKQHLKDKGLYKE